MVVGQTHCRFCLVLAQSSVKSYLPRLPLNVFLLMFLYILVYRWMTCYKHLAEVQQGQVNQFMSQKSGSTAILKDNPLFYLRSCLCSS